MKRLLAILIALSGLTIACDIEDTAPPKVWRRGVEPWLSGNRQWEQCTPGTAKEDRLLPAMQCGPPVAFATHPCPEFITDHADALQKLVESPHCIDEVIRALTRFAATSPEAVSDVAAAHYVRAQRENDPSHLLHAFYAADQAVAARPQSKEARFNLALIQEALHLRSEAMESWDRFLVLDAQSKWADEARKHREQLEPLVAYDVRERWKQTKAQLEAAIAARDEQKVRQLIEHFPSAAYGWLVTLLPKRVADARVLANALSARLGGDPDPLDRVANPTDSLPLRLSAALDRAHGLWDTRQYDAALALLGTIEAQARAHQYLHLVAHIESLRGVSLWPIGRHVESLQAYRTALDIYEQLGNREKAAVTRAKIAGLYLLIGTADRAWREAFIAARDRYEIRNLQELHTFLGESGRVVAAFGYPHLALTYQMAASDEFQRLLPTAAGEDRSAVLMNASIALYHLAALQLKLGRIDDAKQNLDEAGRLAAEHPTEGTRKALDARLSEVRAEFLLRSDPQGAIRALTAAIRNSDKEFPARRAELYAQRAKARLNAKNKEAALRDLEDSFTLARAEQQNILARRTRGEAAEIWSPYFSRYRETSDLLIDTTIRDEQPEAAFYYNERARAAEPLNLLQQFDLFPSELRRRYEANKIDLPYIQAALEPGTFILQYAVQKDQTYVWILSRDVTLAVTLPVTRNDVTEWTRALQNAAEWNDDGEFEARLAAPYGGLFDYVMKTVQGLHGKRGDLPRIVVVPDGPMHGLPFAALRNAAKKRYLVQDAAIEVAGSAALYLVSLERNRALQSDAPSLLLIGNPSIGPALSDTYGLGELPDAQQEVEAIGRLYGAAPITGAKATPVRFLSDAPRHSIIHFAGHAIVNAQEPYRSFLALAAAGDDTGELDAQELLTQIKLDQTRLVILSSCRSAGGARGGAPVGPEGVASLVRPFIGTGVPAVIGSLWDVDDATTRDLLVSFHTRYRKGDDAAAALQAAQLAMLNDKRHPGNRPALAWGSFQVIGHASSPFQSSAAMKKEIPP